MRKNGKKGKKIEFANGLSKPQEESAKLLFKRILAICAGYQKHNVKLRPAIYLIETYVKLLREIEMSPVKNLIEDLVKYASGRK